MKEERNIEKKEPVLKILDNAGMMNITDGADTKKTEEEQKIYMNGVPTRAEVTNFMNGIINEVMLPQIQGIIEKNNLAIDAVLIIFQKILNEKGIAEEGEFRERLLGELELLKNNKKEEGEITG